MAASTGILLGWTPEEGGAGARFARPALHMTAYSFSFLCALLGVRSFLEAFEWRRLISWERGQAAVFVRVETSLGDLIESLESGWVPAPQAWRELSLLPDPWGKVCHRTTERLRQSGASIVPTLRRLRELVRYLGESGGEARNRTAQAKAQALACALMVPVLGIVLDRLMPGVAEAREAWLLICSFAFLLTLGAALSLLRMVERARWGGVGENVRPWLIDTFVAMEELLAGIRAGVPGDLAWTELLEDLSISRPALARALDGAKEAGKPAPQAELFQELGVSVRRAMQLSFMEGRPCLERVETALAAFRTRWRMQVDRELELLPSRALQPLFLGVAPAILGLVGGAVFLAWSAAIGSGGAAG